MHSRIVAFTATAILGLQLDAASLAQAPVIIDRSGPFRVIREIPPSSAPGVVRMSPSGPATPSQPQSEEEKRLQALLTLTFDRSPAAVLEALAKLMAAEEKLTNEIERFEAQVVAGKWNEAGAFLKRMGEDHGPKVYRHVLQHLSNPAPRPRGAPGAAPGPPAAPPPPGPPNNRGPASIPVFTLTPEDILDLSNLAPAPLADEDIRLLGQLLNRSLSAGHFLEPIIARLKAGTGQLGGDDPKARRWAAELLLAAQRLMEAGEFLADVETAKAEKDFATLDLRARYLTAVGRQEKKNEALTQAWDLTQFMLSAPEIPATHREPALRRALELIPAIRQQLGQDWLQNSFSKNPELGMSILAAVGQLVTQGLANNDPKVRLRNLELQKQMVENLLQATGADQPQWALPLSLLARNWVQEADYAKTRSQVQRNQYVRYDPYGNPIYYGGPGQNPNESLPIPTEDIIRLSPDESWQAKLEPTFLPKIQSVLAELYAKLERPREALDFIEALAKDHPKEARLLAQDLLRAWTDARNQNSGMQNRMYGPYGPVVYYGGQQPQGIPLTRAMQRRNIDELAELLKRLDPLGLERLEEKIVVAAFTSAHSRAEVYRLEDIEFVFGPVDQIESEVLSELLQAMRERLAVQWRQPAVQQEARTKRSDKEIEAEVRRGYDLVLGLISKALQSNSSDWRMNLVHAAALFDLAEFEYGKKVDLAVYVEKRDGAFQLFENAARRYSSTVASIEEQDETVFGYEQWFNAALGASDLAYVTRQQEPSTNHLAKIRAAIASLPGEASQRHLVAFAKKMSENVNTLRPELKPRYLRAVMAVTGEIREAEEIRKLVAYYDDLIHEIEFHVEVDGEQTVGHQLPFGLFVNLRHSAAIERESGGFARYLRDQTKNPYYSNPYGQQPRSFLTDFDMQVREKLTDNYEIVSITFHDEKVQSRGYGREHWRETPLAYLLLKAKDASVDKFPSLHMDLDFSDRRGQVILPVESQVQLIDARPAQTAARPVRDIELVQVLDDRELAAQKLTLEIKAKGKGLIPDLRELLDINMAGLKLSEEVDQGLTIAALSTDGDDVAPVSERAWFLHLTGAESREPLTSFRFPKSKRSDVAMIYKRYADADLVEVEPEVAFAGIVLQPASAWKWVVPGALILAALSTLVWFATRQQIQVVDGTAPYSVPAHLTPFSVLTLLRRIHSDAELRLAISTKDRLADEIRQLERHFFSPGIDGNGEFDLESVANEWVSRAGTHSHPAES